LSNLLQALVKKANDNNENSSNVIPIKKNEEGEREASKQDNVFELLINYRVLANMRNSFNQEYEEGKKENKTSSFLYTSCDSITQEQEQKKFTHSTSHENHDSQSVRQAGKSVKSLSRVEK